MFNDLVHGPNLKMPESGVPQRAASEKKAALYDANKEHLILRAGRAGQTGIVNTVAASVVLAKLDERLAGAPASVRAGWIKRALVYESVASLRLNGAYVSAQDLVLWLNDGLDRAPDEDLGRAKGIHSMLSTLMRRNPRHLFKAQRVRALTRLRLHDRAVDHPDLPDWLQERIHTPDELVEALEEALQPSVVSNWEALPPLHAAAEIVANWHRTRAADRIGAAAGRALAMAWVYRASLTSSYCFLPSVGFLGAAFEYRPELKVSWEELFLKACSRAAAWGFKLHSHLALAHRRLHESASQRRSTSHMAALMDLLISTPAVSAAAASRTLDITPHAARAMLNALEERRLIREITGRGSFRLYAAAGLDLAAVS
jgi:HTH DNA binding domain